MQGARRRLEREHNERMHFAWHVAALTRAKRMPRLDSLLAKRRQTPAEQKAIAKLIAKQFRGNKELKPNRPKK